MPDDEKLSNPSSCYCTSKGDLQSHTFLISSGIALYPQGKMVTHTCGLCSKVFRKKWNLIVHMKNVHDINIDEKLINCASCGYETHDRLRFRRHMTRHHPDKPLDRSAFEMIDSNAHKLIECKLCNRVLRYQNMRMHRSRVHKIIDSPNTEYQGIMYDDPANADQHRLRALLENKDLGYESVSIPSQRSDHEDNLNNETLTPDQETSQPAEQTEMHEESTDTEEETDGGNAKKPFKCSMCTQAFKKMKTLKNHLHVEHNAVEKQDYKKSCPICQFHPPGNTVFEMIKHFHTSHNIDVEVVKFRFKSIQEFFAWKLKEEAETCSKFSGRRKFSLRDCITFKCNRSGLRVSKSQGKRKCHPNFSSIKINGFCPANIRATRNPDDTVIVHYMKTHVGHEKDFKTVFLTEAERLKLANNLASKTPGNVVWHDVRGPVYYDDLVQPATAAQEELKAARKEINVCLESKKYDQEAISAWVRERWTTGEFSLIYFKEPGHPDELSQFDIDDFVLFFMSNYQKETFLKHGNEIICFDATNNVNNHNIQMYTLLVSDETYTGFPCVFLFSNRNDNYIFKFFFQKMKDCMGVLTPNVFLTDFSAWYYEAWCSVMGVEPKRLLLCPWRVTESWRTKLVDCVKSREKRREFFKTLENLLYTDSEETFKSLLEELYITCNAEEELSEFYSFFVESYCTRLSVQSWAHCYRINSDYNCHMQVDSYRHILKLCRLFGSKAAMLDKTLIAILRFMGSKLKNMLVKMNQTKVLSKLHALKLHHRNCFRTNISAVNKDGEEWNVTLPDNQNSGKPGLFHVKKIGICCNQCSLPCIVCKSCYHEYSCNCWDYNHHGQMCEHIHLVCRAVIAEQIEETKSQEGETQSAENAPEAMEVGDGEVQEIEPANVLEVKIAENEAENFAKALKTTPQQNLIKLFTKIVTSKVKTHADVLFVDKLLMCIEPSLSALQKQSEITSEKIDARIANVLKQTHTPKLIKQFSASSRQDTGIVFQPEVELTQDDLNPSPKFSSMVEFIEVNHNYAKKTPPPASLGNRTVYSKQWPVSSARKSSNKNIPLKIDLRILNKTKLLTTQKSVSSCEEFNVQAKPNKQISLKYGKIQNSGVQSVKRKLPANVPKLAPKKVFIQHTPRSFEPSPMNEPNVQIKESPLSAPIQKPLLLKILPKPEPGKSAAATPNPKPLLLQILPKPDSGATKPRMLGPNPKPILLKLLSKPDPNSKNLAKPAKLAGNVVAHPVKVVSKRDNKVVPEEAHSPRTASNEISPIVEVVETVQTSTSNRTEEACKAPEDPVITARQENPAKMSATVEKLATVKTEEPSDICQDPVATTDSAKISV